jgi:hypothetical protein
MGYDIWVGPSCPRGFTPRAFPCSPVVPRPARPRCHDAGQETDRQWRGHHGEAGFRRKPTPLEKVLKVLPQLTAADLLRRELEHAFAQRGPHFGAKIAVVRPARAVEHSGEVMSMSDDELERAIEAIQQMLVAVRRTICVDV